jgi:hypothetical protein
MSKRKAQTPHAELPAFQLAELAQNPEAAQDAFRDNKLLLVRGFSAHNGESRCLKALQKVLERDAAVLHDSWCVENPGSAKEASLGLEEVLNKQEKCHAENYYVSCIIQGDNNLVGEFEKDIDFKDPSFTSKWKNFRHTKPLWIFYGHNEGKLALEGRAEHTDSVSHDGTWHIQLHGKKVWYCRPMEDSEEWGDSVPTQFKDGLRIEVQAGDCLMINTRLWWHRTELPPSAHSSISIARDFFCPAVRCGSKRRRESTGDEGQEEEDIFVNRDGVYAATAVAAGEVILREAEMPDCALTRSTQPNAFVTENEEGEGCLVALRDIVAGEFFSVAESDSEEDDDGDDDEDEGDAVDAQGGNSEGEDEDEDEDEDGESEEGGSEDDDEAVAEEEEVGF